MGENLLSVSMFLGRLARILKSVGLRAVIDGFGLKLTYAFVQTAGREDDFGGPQIFAIPLIPFIQ